MASLHGACNMGKSQRTKGHGGERELCALLSDALGTVVKRHLGQAREGGGDIELGPFLIEVKRRARIAGVHQWMNQACKACTPKHHIPVIAFRADGQSWVVAFRLPEAVELMREALSESVPWKDNEDD